MDKLQAIRFFLKLGDTLSFKGTAAHFGVPPSTVSRAIKALEQSLGTSLVERTTRQVRLTETGAWYRSEVSGPLRAIAAANEGAQERASEPVGTVRLTALPGYGEIRLFAVLERFRAAYPQIVCDLELTDRYLDLSTGEVDVALRATADPPDYMIARRLHSNRFTLVASPAYLERCGRPTCVSEVAEHAALAYRGPAGAKPWPAMRSDGELLMIERRPVLISNHGLMILDAAIAGEGIAYLPVWGVSDALADGRLEEIVLGDAQVGRVGAGAMDMLMLYQPNKARLGKVRALVDFLEAELVEA